MIASQDITALDPKLSNPSGPISVWQQTLSHLTLPEGIHLDAMHGSALQSIAHLSLFQNTVEQPLALSRDFSPKDRRPWLSRRHGSNTCSPSLHQRMIFLARKYKMASPEKGRVMGAPSHKVSPMLLGRQFFPVAISRDCDATSVFLTGYHRQSHTTH